MKASRVVSDVARSSAKLSRTSLATDDGHIRLDDDGVYEVQIDVPSSDLEQYEEDRPQPRKPAEARPSSVGEERLSALPVECVSEPEPVAEPVKSKSLFPPGTLLLWNGNQLGIYKEHLEHKGYDLLYVVERDGTLQPKGVCLFAYAPQPMGMLSDGLFRWMEQTMRWDRDALVVHFSNPEDVGRVQALQQPQAAERIERVTAPESSSVADKMLVRGRAFTISVGESKWSGVYWGRDAIGAIVAHNTNHVWNLMHLNLERFGDSVRFGAIVPRKKMREIEKAVGDSV